MEPGPGWARCRLRGLPSLSRPLLSLHLPAYLLQFLRTTDPHIGNTATGNPGSYPSSHTEKTERKKKKKNHCSSPSVPVRKGKDPDWPMWVVFLGMGRSCDRGRVNEPGSGLVTCPSLWPRRETGRHPPVLTEVEIKPLPKDKDCCYQKAGRRRAWANSTHPLCYFRGEKQVMQGHIIIFYVRYLQQQTSLPPQAWKSEDKDLTPDGIFYLSPNNFWEVEQVHHPS